MQAERTVLSERERRCLAAIGEGGHPTTRQVANRMNYSAPRDARENGEPEESRSVLPLARHLADRGFIEERLVMGLPRWTLTAAGRKELGR